MSPLSLLQLLLLVGSVLFLLILRVRFVLLRRCVGGRHFFETVQREILLDNTGGHGNIPVGGTVFRQGSCVFRSHTLDE